jgi:hypothetical protein
MTEHLARQEDTQLRRGASQAPIRSGGVGLSVTPDSRRADCNPSPSDHEPKNGEH